MNVSGAKYMYESVQKKNFYVFTKTCHTLPKLFKTFYQDLLFTKHSI